MKKNEIVKAVFDELIENENGKIKGNKEQIELTLIEFTKLSIQELRLSKNNPENETELDQIPDKSNKCFKNILKEMSDMDYHLQEKATLIKLKEENEQVLNDKIDDLLKRTVHS